MCSFLFIENNFLFLVHYGTIFFLKIRHIMTKTHKVTKEVNLEDSGEVRKFHMHPDLLFSVIKAQAGTQEKAILEAVMNAVDAGAKSCTVTVDQHGYEISDDGKGFVSKQEIEDFFATFGTPHKEDDAIYGRFRMGRGQLFAFSTTTWRTSTFEMQVDIQKSGLDYILKENLPFVNGCTIVGKWYKKMATQELFIMIKELESLIKYMQIPVLVNGKNFSVDPETQKWNYKEDDFFVKVNKSGNTLSVYNMGALVSHYPASKFGVAGTVVTKSALKVNFARNDVLTSECLLWKKINKKMKEIMGIETAKKNVLTDAEREAILNNVICEATLIGEVIQKGLLVDISGKKISFRALLDAKRLTFSTGNSKLKKIEERVNDQKLAMVLSDSILEKFYVTTPKEFVNAVNDLIAFNNEEVDFLISEAKEQNEDWRRYNYLYGLKVHDKCTSNIVDINELINNINNAMDNIETKALTKKQRIFLKATQDISGWIGRMVYAAIHGDEKYIWKDAQKFERVIYLGTSEVAKAWTDGSTYITIEAKNISSHPMTIVHLLIHEYCHNEATNESHDHGSEFYELYHEVLRKSSKHLFDAALKFQKTYNKIMLKEGVKPKKTYDETLQINENYELLKDEEVI